MTIAQPAQFHADPTHVVLNGVANGHIFPEYFNQSPGTGDRNGDRWRIRFMVQGYQWPPQRKGSAFVMPALVIRPIHFGIRPKLDGKPDFDNQKALKMKIRITILLMFAIGGLVALAMGAVLAISATANVKNTLELLNRRAALTVSLVETGVANHVVPVRNLIAHIQRLVLDGDLDTDNEEQMETALKSSLAAAPQIAGIVFQRPDGTGLRAGRSPTRKITVHRDNLIFTGEMNENYKKSLNSSQINWGKPFARKNRPVMTISGRITRGPEVLGVIASGLSLVEMSEFVDTAIANTDMTSFVLYGNDKVLAHPAMLKPEVRKLITHEQPLPGLDQIGDPVLAGYPEKAVEDLPSSTTFQLREMELGDEDYIILTRNVDRYGDVPWQVGVHIPASAVSAQMERLVGSIGMGLGLFVLAVVAALLLASRIAKPIRAISSAAGRVATLNVKDIEPLPHSRIAELDEQSRAFNRMVTGLKWFETYVPRQLVNRLMEAPEGPSVGHREAELTVMFTDIVGFTRQSEAMPPAEVAEFLNHHFDMVNGCIEAEGGTLDKYIGDAAMAFWGAPEAYTDHAARACRTALALLKAAEDDNAKGHEPKVRIKVAIHTGPLIVGNIGAKARMNYTVIGDTVNVASRIEKLCSEEDDGSAAIIIVSGETVRAAGEGFNFDSIGTHSVKGRAKPVEMWRLRP